MACYWETFCFYDVWRKSDLVCFQKLPSAAASPSEGLVKTSAQAGLPRGAGQPADVCYTVQEIQFLQSHEAAI